MLRHAAGILRSVLPTLGEPPLGNILVWATRGLRRDAAARRRTELQHIDDELLPKVAVVGRPNVGKSALFNRLLRRRAALVYDTPASHVTRDYQEGRAQLGDLVFRASDTSGLEPRTANSGSTIQGRATAITANLLRQSHLTLMVIDAREGVMPADEELAEWLRRQVSRDQVLLVANKAEGSRAREAMPQTVYDCYRLGFGEPVAVSSTTGEGLTDLYAALQPHLDRIAAELAQAAAPAAGAAGEVEAEPLPGAAVTAAGGGGAVVVESLRAQRKEAEEGQGGAGGEEAVAVYGGAVTGGAAGRSGGGGVLKMAIMGLPNAGKSTLMNRLLGEERALTGPEPGLTRDAVRASWMYGNQPVELIDTAGWIGVGRTGSYDDVGGEVAAMSRRATLRSLAQVHVALLVVDAERAMRSERVLARRELTLASAVLREGKALVVAANKADALTAQQRTLFGKSLRQHLSQRFLEAGQLPVVEISARRGTGVEQLMPAVVASYEAWNKRVPTWRLNRFVRKLAVRMAGTGAMESNLTRLKFILQLKARPPTFVVFLAGSRSRPVEGTFPDFLAQQIREVMGFQGVPMRIWFRYMADIRRARLRLGSGGSKRRRADPQEAEAAEVEAVEAEGASPSFSRGSIIELARRRAAELRRDDPLNSEDEEDRGVDEGGTAVGSPGPGAGGIPARGPASRRRRRVALEEEGFAGVWEEEEEFEDGGGGGDAGDRAVGVARGHGVEEGSEALRDGRGPGRASSSTGAAGRGWRPVGLRKGVEEHSYGVAGGTGASGGAVAGRREEVGAASLVADAGQLGGELGMGAEEGARVAVSRGGGGRVGSGASVRQLDEGEEGWMGGEGAAAVSGHRGARAGGGAVGGVAVRGAADGEKRAPGGGAGRKRDAGPVTRSSEGLGEEEEQEEEALSARAGGVAGAKRLRNGSRSGTAAAAAASVTSAGGAGAGAPAASTSLPGKRALLYRALLWSRKPSAPLLPVKPPGPGQAGGRKRVRSRSNPP